MCGVTVSESEGNISVSWDPLRMWRGPCWAAKSKRKPNSVPGCIRLIDKTSKAGFRLVEAPSAAARTLITRIGLPPRATWWSAAHLRKPQRALRE